MRTTLLAVILLWPMTALPQSTSEYTGSGPFHTGRTLLDWCAGEDNAETLLCMGYLAGVSDALEGIAYNAGWGTSGVCRPKGTTIGRLREALVQWTDEHPAQGNKAGSLVVIMALQETFPCEESGPAE